MRTGDELTDSPRLARLAEFYRDSVDRPSAAELARAHDTLLARIAAHRSRRRRLVPWSLAGAAVAASVLIALQIASGLLKGSSTPEPPPLAYQVNGGRVIEGGYLRESGHAGMRVLFNEGSRFSFTPGTRGRIRSVDRIGAHVAVEHGTASCEIVRRSGRRWLVDAGPFLVTVKGTGFTVSWDPLREQFELRLRHGRVVVSGPVSAGDIELRAGQRLVVNLARAETVITEETPDQGGTEAVGASAAGFPPEPAPQPPTVNPQSANPSPSIGASSAASAGERRWSDELARGNWDRILDEVKRVGVKPTLSRASSEDLFALANAARYRRQFDLAGAALLAQRRRFPDSPRALDALFLLGRVEESRERGVAQAIAWYDEYLARAPSGPFVGEALGRKMILTDKLEGPAQARPLAEDYLRRFPKGGYAGPARELIRAR